MSIGPIALDIGGSRCDLIDDGGRQLEPSEWITRFQDQDAVVYVVSLPGYCQTIPGSVLKVRIQANLT